jgi:hypothetical protein
VIAVLAATACGQKPTASPDFAAQRQRMVQQQLVPRGIKDGRVLAAMTKVPREEFVPPGEKLGSNLKGVLPKSEVLKRK